ncbi:energy transducer TonB [Longibacter salinarum]|uniref:Energy transducer TonB n=1 Tax=Longibacter salinarum TaxID=1850348 RepID=A0A2A8CTT0_9BACT|nr:energy transducer TonB [Longibacter salinarum]PEN11096.1 energy transducer TonB [Longibacter salinarum]
MTASRWMLVLAMAVTLVLTGCSSEDPSAPPSGWESADGRWWKSGVDTSTVFRNLESLKAMGITDTRTLSISQGQMTRAQMQEAVKRSILPLFQHDPETIDSLFRAKAVPVLSDVSLSGDIREKVQGEYKQKAYKAINNHYREPRRTETGEGMVFPDSLRNEENRGTVELQVFVNANGEPEGIEVVESLHPTLDGIAMRTTTQMKWQPAFLKVNNEWVEQASFVRFGVDFGR